VHAAPPDGLAVPARGRKVLDNRAVHGELVGRGGGARGGGTADEGFEDCVDYRGVPRGDLRVVVGRGGGDGGGAGFGGDFREVGVGDWEVAGAHGCGFALRERG